MATSDSPFSEAGAARPDAPWDLDAPWVVEPPSRLTFLADEGPPARRLLRALGRRVMALVHAAASTPRG